MYILQQEGGLAEGMGFLPVVAGKSWLFVIE